MSEPPTSGGTGAARKARRIEEAVLEVDGVAGVRVWLLGDRVEVGVRAAPHGAATDVLTRVVEALDALRAPDDLWEVGLLTDP